MARYDTAENVFVIGKSILALEKKFSLLIDAQRAQIQAQARIIELLDKILENQNANK